MSYDFIVLKSDAIPASFEGMGELNKHSLVRFGTADQVKQTISREVPDIRWAPCSESDCTVGAVPAELGRFEVSLDIEDGLVLMISIRTSIHGDEFALVKKVT